MQTRIDSITISLK